MKQTTRFRILAAALASFAAAAATADDDVVVPPEEFVFCTVCHGVQLMGNRNIEAPRLSGMEAWYVEQSLVAFKLGWRGSHPEDLVGMEMRPMAEVLSDEQIEAAAKFTSRTRSPLPAATIDGDPAAGKRHYRSCAICHGVDAEGDGALGAPALTGLDDWYLVRQLENYARGVRGSHPEDTYGQQMRAAMAPLGDDQAIRDVVKYITNLQTDQGAQTR